MCSRWLTLCVLVLFTAFFAAGARAADPLPVRVEPFEVTSPRLPPWLGTNLQSAIADDIRKAAGLQLVEQALAGAPATQPSADPAAYRITGRCEMEQNTLRITGAIEHVPTGRLVQQFGTAGQLSDLLQLKEALLAAFRQASAVAFAPPPVAPPLAQLPAAPAVPSAPPQPSEPSLQVPLIDPGARYEGSSLQWSLQNPGQYERELETYWQRRPQPAPYRSTGYWYYPRYYYNYGYTPYIGRAYDYSGFGIQIGGSYSNDKWDIDFRVGGGQVSEQQR